MKCLFVVILSFMATSFWPRTCDADQCPMRINEDGWCRIASGKPFFNSYFMSRDPCYAAVCRTDGTIVLHVCNARGGGVPLTEEPNLFIGGGPMPYPECCKNCTSVTQRQDQ
uniref:8.9 kDa family member n=1 Tax=Rhipicephalus pulchellus TaxID=72859 RepID=L7LW22_RHIPC